MMIAVFVSPTGRLYSTPAPDRYAVPRFLGTTSFRGLPVVTAAYDEADQWLDLYVTPIQRWPNRVQMALVLCLEAMKATTANPRSVEAGDAEEIITTWRVISRTYGNRRRITVYWRERKGSDDLERSKTYWIDRVGIGIGVRKAQP